MDYQRIDIKVDDQKQILESLITSDEFCKKVFSELDLRPEYFYKPLMKAYRIIRKYYEEESRAPKQNMKALFAVESMKMPQEQSDFVELTLMNLSDDYVENYEPEKWNMDHLFKITKRFCWRRNLELRIREAEILCNPKIDKLEEAEALLQGIGTDLPQQKHEGILIGDDNEIKAAVDEVIGGGRKSLFYLPGIAGRIAGKFLRQELVGYLANTKVGKSWFLQATANCAYEAGLNVAFVSLEMSKSQSKIRFYSELAGVSEYPGINVQPIWDCLRNQQGECNIPDRAYHREYEVTAPMVATLRTNPFHLPRIGFEDFDKDGIRREYEDIFTTDPLLMAVGQPQPDGTEYIPCDYCRRHKFRNYELAIWGQVMKDSRPFDYNWIKGQMMMNRRSRHNGFGITRRLSDVWLNAFPRGTATVDDIFRSINMYERQQGILFDVVLIDYADALRAPQDKRQYSERSAHEQNWEKMAQYADSKDILVVTATQTNRLAKNKVDSSIYEIAEDYRKAWIAQKILILHQTKDEKRNSIVRMSTAFDRFSNPDEDDQAVIIQNLSVGWIIGSSEYEQRTWNRKIRSVCTDKE